MCQSLSDPLDPLTGSSMSTAASPLAVADPLLTHSVRCACGCGSGVQGTDPLLTHSSKNVVIIRHKRLSSEKAQAHKPRPLKHFHSKAGDGIRTHDVQLGNSVLGAQTLALQTLTSRFSAENEDYN